MRYVTALLALVLTLSPLAVAQTPPVPRYVVYRTAAAFTTGTCTQAMVGVATDTGRTYTCSPGSAWAPRDLPACAANPPTGACQINSSDGSACVRSDTGAIYSCISNVWTATGATLSGSTGQVPYISASGALTGAPGMVVTGSGLISTTKFRYEDADTDGDGTIDQRTAGDYNGDGTLTISDIQSALDTFCDSNSDGTQNVKAVDRNGDGTSENQPYCGRFIIRPGVYTGDTNGSGAVLTMKWSGVSIIGYGATIKANVGLRNYLYSSLAPVGAKSATYNIITATATNKPIADVTFEGFQVVGSGSRLNLCYASHASAASDCNVDPDNDSLSDGSSHCMVITNPDNVTLRNVTIRDCDRQGLSTTFTPTLSGYLDTSRGILVDNATFKGEFGEHCMEPDGPNSRIVNSFFQGCDGTIQPFDNNGDGTNDITNAGKIAHTQAIHAIEFYFGTNLATTGTFYQNLVVSNNQFESLMNGVGAFGTGNTLTWGTANISNNTFHNMRGYSVLLATNTANETVKNVSINNNVISTVTSYPSNIPATWTRLAISARQVGGTLSDVSISDNTINENRVSGNALTNSDAVIIAQGTHMKVDGNTIYFESDAAGAGDAIDTVISVNSGAGVSVSHNTIRVDNNTTWGGSLKGTHGVYVSTCSGCNISGNNYTTNMGGAAIGTVPYFAALVSATNTKVNDNIITYAAHGTPTSNTLQRGVLVSGGADVTLADNTMYRGSKFAAYSGVTRVSEKHNRQFRADNEVFYMSDCASASSCTEEGNEAIGSYDGGDAYTGRGWYHDVDRIYGGSMGNGTLDSPTRLWVLGSTVLTLAKATNALCFENGTYNTRGCFTTTTTADATWTIPNKPGTVALSSGAAATGGVALWTCGCTTTCTTICANAGLSCTATQEWSAGNTACSDATCNGATTVCSGGPPPNLKLCLCY